MHDNKNGRLDFVDNVLMFQKFINFHDMRTLLLFFILTVPRVMPAQALRDINYTYEYDADSYFSFKIKPVKQLQEWSVFYNLQMLDSSFITSDFSITWEIREDLQAKQGTARTTGLHVLHSAPQNLSGTIHLEFSTKTQIVVAKVTNNAKKQAWFYYKILPPTYTVSQYLRGGDDQLIFEPYVDTHKPVRVDSLFPNESFIVSYYKNNFPSAAPAFSEGMAKVSQMMKPDSSFSITNAQAIIFQKVGLYLIQKDTSSFEGLAFRAETNYPKFRRLEDLVGPMAYVCTKEEFHTLRMAGEDKKRFDKGILAITRDVSRAKDFMKNYFDRVESANCHFTSYKEGWKTDRGMVYIIYGQPESVVKFIDREVWSYGKTNFTFIKSATLFDPENYVLIRNKKFADEWYEKVDLLRNGRF
jgi:GWxTD domain-containing protein